MNILDNLLLIIRDAQIYESSDKGKKSKVELEKFLKNNGVDLIKNPLSACVDT